MNDSLLHREVTLWLNRAKSDLRVAYMAFKDDVPEFGLTCYLSQQCVEKAFKALLISFKIRFRHKHDLLYLSELLPADH